MIERPATDGAFEHVLVSESDERRPTVILYPTIMGRSDLELGFARRLAGAGYAVLVADLYGREYIGKPREECRALMMALLGDRAALGARLLAVLETTRAQPEVDPARVAAIGFCFGGLCALDLARGGADIAGAASFHGLLKPPPGPQAEAIGARILVLHGWDDPLAPPEEVAALGAELTAAGADWQIHAYGNTAHAFTNPNAADRAGGFSYDARAARRAWASCDAFLEECFER